jgi:predicted RND superfamily exporter protein
LLLTVLVGKEGAGLYFDTDYRAFFSEENPQVQAFDELQEVYTKNDNILFVVAPNDGHVFGSSALAAVEALVEEAWTIPYAIRVDAITNFQRTFADYDDLIVEDLVEDATIKTDEALAEAQRIALSEPLIRDRLINGDASVTGVNVTLQLPGLDPTEVTAAVETARRLSDQFSRENAGIEVYLTGFAMLNNAFQEISMSELTRLMPIMFGLMILLMILLLRSATGTFVTMMIIGLSTTMAMGLGGMFNVGLTPPSAQAPTIIMTLAIADSIHILVTMLREMRSGAGKLDAIVESIRVNASPVFLTSLSTVIGFLSLNFSDVPPFKHLGNITAAGVTAAFFLSILFLPALLAILPIRTRTRSRASRPSPIMDRLADFVIRQRRPVLIGSAAIILGFAALIPANELDDRFVEYFDDRIEFRTDTDFASENLTGIYQIEFSLNAGESGGISNPAYLAAVDAFADWYRSQPDVVHVSSIGDIMKRLNKNLNGDDEGFYRLPDSREMAAQYLLLYEMSLPYGLDLNNQINVDKSATRFTVTTENTSASRFRELTEEGEKWLADNAPPAMAASGSGPAVMFSYISGININSMLKGSLIALVLISFLMIFALRSVKLGLISFIPNLLPAVMAFGVWAVLSGTVNLGLSIVIGMTMGIVVDDSIHFLSKYRRARIERGDNAEDAIRYAFSSVGRAIVVTSIILVAGFGILSTSAFGMNADMGLMTAITIGLALTTDLLALPAILLWLDAREVNPAVATTTESGLRYLEPSPVRVTR